MPTSWLQSLRTPYEPARLIRLLNGLSIGSIVMLSNTMSGERIESRCLRVDLAWFVTLEISRIRYWLASRFQSQKIAFASSQRLSSLKCVFARANSRNVTLRYLNKLKLSRRFLAISCTCRMTNADTLPGNCTTVLARL